MTERTPQQAEALQALKDSLQLDPQKTAVITIDMHRGHLDATQATVPVPADVRERVIDAGSRVVRIARERGMPVIHVIVTYRPIEIDSFNPRVATARILLGSQVPRTEAQEKGTKHNLQGSVQCEIIPEIGPEPGDYVIDNKKTYDIFFGTDLELLLARFLKVDAVVLLGINTNTCVLNSAFQACNRGYKTIVMEEAVGSCYGEDLHEFALENISRTMGWVLTVDELERKLGSAVTARKA